MHEHEGDWSEEDLSYCRSTLRRVARELISTGRGRLVSVVVDSIRINQRREV